MAHRKGGVTRPVDSQTEARLHWPPLGRVGASAEGRAAVSRNIRISRDDLERVVKEALEDNPNDETAKRMQQQLLKNPKKQVWEFDWIFDVGE